MSIGNLKVYPYSGTLPPTRPYPLQYLLIVPVPMGLRPNYIQNNTFLVMMFYCSKNTL
ncbi:hypothetical protein ACRRTK_013237 [Alexandromys fortis]